MRTETLHQTQAPTTGFRVKLGIAALFLLLILAIAFQLYQSRQACYMPYDAQESEAK